MGATVTGIDAVEKNIKIARLHPVYGFEDIVLSQGFLLVFERIRIWIQQLKLLNTVVQQQRSLPLLLHIFCVKPINTAIAVLFEKLVEEQRKFDTVIALEVIEHVADVTEFCKSLSALTAHEGATVVSTINRSMRSYATAIVAAEYLLQWLPKGTHQWSSFLTPEELTMIPKRAGVDVKEMAGFVYNPLTGRWSLLDDISVNLIAYGTKEK
ncbi:hypothetical protein CXB51_001902 [Gossypium anomalum]|uniref:Uncharacterized protein n=1 Tax=Gossypium anomalum TaxID=47600 RepID=A0A8J6D9W0_9ROSI|nr:hypothetical protein CXB51_001902 [Gossypium anomalum]